MNPKLIAARKAKKMTIAKAAFEMGISYGMLAMMESGKRNGSDNTKLKISNYYGSSVQDLFYTH